MHTYSGSRSSLPLPDPPLVLAGGELLRPWLPDDSESLFSAWTDSEIASRLPVPADVSLSRASDWIAGESERRRMGLALDLVISGSKNRVLGEVGLASFDFRRGIAHIGWWICEEERCRGLASSAARVVTGWALDVLGLVALIADIRGNNLASVEVANKAGYFPISAKGELWVATKDSRDS